MDRLTGRRFDWDDMTRTVTLAARHGALRPASRPGSSPRTPTSVMPGLRRVDDRTFVAVMQNINVAILNGWFLVVFLGPLVLGVVGALQFWRTPVVPWVLGGLALYVLTLVVTFAVNVPLNNALADAGADLAAARAAFEASWVRWNLVRTVTSTGAFVQLRHRTGSRVRQPCAQDPRALFNSCCHTARNGRRT